MYESQFVISHRHPFYNSITADSSGCYGEDF
jgi:hypothetical protein